MESDASEASCVRIPVRGMRGGTARTGTILVTGGGGAVGSAVCELLADRGCKVRAVVRQKDDRSDRLAARGVEIAVGDLCDLHAAHRAVGNNLDDGQPATKLHWLAEQALDWSRLPAVTVRPTAFLNTFFHRPSMQSIRQNRQIRLPFGSGRISPVASDDVAKVIATVLEAPEGHVGKIYELTGPRSQPMTGIADEFSEALDRTISSVDVPFEPWRKALAEGVGGRRWRKALAAALGAALLRATPQDGHGDAR
jgi:uncharacterized protein YbjT (DUF2867 family)